VEAGVEGRLLVFEQLKALDRPFANVLQVGAHRGQEIAAYENYGVDWAIMVEPQDEAFSKLSRRAAGRDHFIPVQALCSNEDGVECDFYVASNEGASSSLMRPMRHLEEYPKIAFPDRVKMTSTTLDTLVAREADRRPDLDPACFDTLLIDVQGAELKVLIGAVRLLPTIRHVFTEVSYDLYENGATLDQLQGFLRAFGFQLHFLQLNRRGWGDGLFVRT
jgi:FkbM family methyltransferase